jgi:hypothetical protein
MRSFFNTTYYFWVVWRAILIVLGMISLISIISIGDLKNIEVIVNFSFFIYLILLSIIFVKEVQKAEQNRVIKIVAGIYSILFAIGLFTTIAMIGNNKSPALGFVGMLFSIWSLLLGFFDIIIQQRKADAE